jgi:PPM family protein phosphatase
MSDTNDAQPLGDTVEAPLAEVDPSASALAGKVRVDCAALSHRGLVRPNNEDHFFVSRIGRFLEPLLTNLAGVETLFEEEGHGMLVADGLGGAAAGEVASALAIRTLLSLVKETRDWIMSPLGKDVDRIMERMMERYRLIDAALIKEAADNEHLQGMGTTMTLACNVGATLMLVHIGDSRGYLYRHGVLSQLTRDHTLAQALVDLGDLRRIEDGTTHMRHALVRLLGGKGGQCQPDVQRLSLLDKDILVLCTDGLTDMVDDAGIQAILAANAPAADTCRALLEQAMKNGGRDNVTAIVARFGFFA